MCFYRKNYKNQKWSSCKKTTFQFTFNSVEEKSEGILRGQLLLEATKDTNVWRAMITHDLYVHSKLSYYLYKMYWQKAYHWKEYTVLFDI